MSLDSPDRPSLHFVRSNAVPHVQVGNEDVEALKKKHDREITELKATMSSAAEVWCVLRNPL